MQLDMHIVDAFTRQAFSGNQAAVVLLDGDWLPNALMQQIAAENNLSETAFVRRLGPGEFAIRWFSPLTEIDFCGHATLASAAVLFAETDSPAELGFQAEAVGSIRVTRAADGRIEMAFPNLAPHPVEPPAALLEGLSLPGQAYLRNGQAYFVILADEAQVRAVVPDIERLKTLAPYDVVVTAPGREHDFVSRYFWPANGGVEDPVTGSIHAGLAPYWGQRLGRTELRAWQASQRGGELFCRLEGERVYVAGYCVRYLSGRIHL